MVAGNGVHTPKSHGFGTKAIHLGSDPDPSTNAVIAPISLATTFKQDGVGNHRGFEYSRSGNPNRNAFEQAVAGLEDAEYGIAFSSGSAATSTIVTALVPPGGHIISINDVYGGTYRYFTKVAKLKGVQTSFVDFARAGIDGLESICQENTKIIWVESPTNPTLQLVDIQAIASFAKERGIVLVVDNTFQSPYFQQPLTLGADIVVHSVTKYCNGHSDVVMGIALTRSQALMDTLRFHQNAIGAIPSPFDCWLAHRGLKTLHLRMKRHGENALAMAKHLEKSSHVREVIYPGLASHPQYHLAWKNLSELARRDVISKGGDGMQDFACSGMISFRIRAKEGQDKKGFALAFLSNLKIFTLAESLGGIESLAEHPAMMTHGSVSLEDREKLGIGDDLVRLSVGIEDEIDLIKDLTQALDTACLSESR